MKQKVAHLYCSKCGQQITDYLIKHWILKHPGDIKWEDNVQSKAD